jgi:hypothetical protein
MPSVAPPLDLALADDLRRECLAFLQRQSEPHSTLVLLKGTRAVIEHGQRTEDPTERWSYAAYGPDQLRDLEAMYAQRGVPLLHEISGMLVAIPQTHLLEELKGRTLTRGGLGLVLVDRGDGI